MTSHLISFADLSRTTMTALLANDLATARAESGVELDALFVTERAKWLWNLRIKQLEAEPEAAAWIARAVVVEPDGVVIGYAGFHGPPDDRGMVEVGYTVGPAHRRRGYATAILTALLERAAAEPGVQVVRASIRSGQRRLARDRRPLRLHPDRRPVGRGRRSGTPLRTLGLTVDW